LAGKTLKSSNIIVKVMLMVEVGLIMT